MVDPIAIARDFRHLFGQPGPQVAHAELEFAREHGIFRPETVAVRLELGDRRWRGALHALFAEAQGEDPGDASEKQCNQRRNGKAQRHQHNGLDLRHSTCPQRPYGNGRPAPLCSIKRRRRRGDDKNKEIPKRTRGRLTPHRHAVAPAAAF